MTIFETKDLTGAQLDWAVAFAEGKHAAVSEEWGNACINDLWRCSIAHRNWNCAKYFEPSKNWGHGGPIIERERISVGQIDMPTAPWLADVSKHEPGGLREIGRGAGPTPLIAAMRAYVASKLGGAVDVPDYPARWQAIS